MRLVDAAGGSRAEGPRKLNLKCLNWVKMNLSETNYTFMFDVHTFFWGTTALFTCNILVGLPTHVYVVWLIAGRAGGTLASELFALNLSISEIFFCISSLYVMLHLWLNMPIDIGTFILQFILQLMFISRPVFQSCMCLERYLAVVHPTVFLRFKPLRYKVACCVVDWLLVLLYCIVPVVTLSVIESMYLLVCVSLSFLVLMLYSGVHVLCVLKQPGPGDGDRDRERRNSIKRKAFKVIVITLVFTSTAEFLQVLLLGPTLLCASRQVVKEVILVGLSVSIISGFVTSLLYLHRAGKLPCIKF